MDPLMIALIVAIFTLIVLCSVSAGVVPIVVLCLVRTS